MDARDEAATTTPSATLESMDIDVFEGTAVVHAQTALAVAGEAEGAVSDVDGR